MSQNAREHYAAYQKRLIECLQGFDFAGVEKLAQALRRAWLEKRRVFLIGNGGSAANACHLANDLNYGIGKQHNGVGLRVHALTANSSILTCLGNDIGYENIFSQQLRVQANRGDLLIALSGSGNSPNIVNALQAAQELEVESYAILGYSGGRAKTLAGTAIHFAVDDMQISEDLQLIVGHMVMQRLCQAE